MAAVNEMRLPDFSVCLQAQVGIMPLKGKCIPRVQRVVLIYELYYSDKTERELAEELHKTQQNIHKMKHKILCKLYEILK